MKQTALTYLAAMDGRVKALKYQRERDLTLAYHTGAFARASGADVKSLSYYLDALRAPADQPRKNHSGALHFFRLLQARGSPVSIERINSEGQ